MVVTTLPILHTLVGVALLGAIARGRPHALARFGLTLVLAFIVWWDFVVGHVIANLRGLA